MPGHEPSCGALHRVTPRRDERWTRHPARSARWPGALDEGDGCGSGRWVRRDVEALVVLRLYALHRRGGELQRRSGPRDEAGEVGIVVGDAHAEVVGVEQRVVALVYRPARRADGVAIDVVDVLDDVAARDHRVAGS